MAGSVDPVGLQAVDRVQLGDGRTGGQLLLDDDESRSHH